MAPADYVEVYDRTFLVSRDPVVPAMVWRDQGWQPTSIPSGAMVQFPARVLSDGEAAAALAGRRGNAC
jgi:hypothetical protein